MGKIRSIGSKFALFFKKHPRYQKTLIILLIALAGLVLFIAVRGSQLPSNVWLPDASVHKSDNEILFYLPVKHETVTTKYGRAIRYTATTKRSTEPINTAPWTVIYEFRGNKLLTPSTCPNIADTETLSPSDCDNLGEFEGSPVYAIQRSLPSGATEYFTNIDGVFIYIKMGGDGVGNLDYLKTFKVMPRNEATSYLAANNKRVEQLLAKQRAEKVATDHASALAYTRLGFTPIVPGTIPEGWNTPQAKSIEIDGPDANTPKMVNITYSNKSNSSLVVRWHVGKLSDFKIGPTCGPSPGYKMEYLTCYKVPGTNYYEAVLYDEMNDFVRYVYYPVGDSIVISSIVAHSGSSGKRPDWPTELVKVQDQLTLSAKPTALADLKGSTFRKLYYY